MKKNALLLILIFIIIGGYFSFKIFASKPEIRALKTARVARGNIRDVLVETGIIKPQVGAQIKIGARATGEIVAMNVKVGSLVKKDDLIAWIDDREIVYTIEQLNAAIMSKKHTLSQTGATS